MPQEPGNRLGTRRRRGDVEGRHQEDGRAVSTWQPAQVGAGRGRTAAQSAPRRNERVGPHQ